LIERCINFIGDFGADAHDSNLQLEIASLREEPPDPTFDPGPFGLSKKLGTSCAVEDQASFH
jgi:hypothetical protein